MFRLLRPNSGWLTPARLAWRVIEQRLGRNRPLFATIVATDRCNVRCDGCVCHAALRDPAERGNEDTARTLRLLAALAEDGVPAVTIAGGEPFLRGDLPVLLRYGRRVGLSLSLVTNAMKLTDEGLAAADESCSAVCFSPHPPSELGGNRSEEKYVQAWEGFVRMRRHLHRPEVVCTITIGRHTVPMLDEIIRRALEIGADQIEYQPNFFPDQFPSLTEVGKAAALIRRHSGEHPGKFPDPHVFLDRMERFFGDRPWVPCTANRRFNVGVFPDGTVSACCSARVPIGNLFERPLRAMIDHEVEVRPDCFGCHRVDVIKALKLCGDRRK
ncbi:MAG: radical SAM protein [Deltaproteobacteria bacterium]|nr:radical SAM protein [Deltaproteobacteria bacterium]